MTVDDFHPQARKLYESPGYQRVVRDLKRGKGKNRNTGKKAREYRGTNDIREE